MSLRSKILSTTFAAVGVGLLSTMVIAQEAPKADGAKAEKHGKWGGRGHGMRGGHHHGFPGLHALNLTDAQREQIRTIMQSNRPDEATMQEMRTLRQAKRAGTLTAEQTARLEVLREQAMARRAAVHEQILAILTPEQRTTLEQKKQEMQQRRHEFREKRQEYRKNHPAKTAPAAPVG